MKKISTQVVIIGAGPSGSVAASLLHKKGIDVRVIEKSLFPRFSIGESLLPACMEVIEQAGMSKAVAEANFQFKDGAAFRKNDVYTAFNFEDKFSSGPGTTFQVQRGAFDKVLADAAEAQGITIDYQHELMGIDFTEGSTTLDVQVLDGERYQLEAQYVLDGSGFGRVLPKMLNLEEPSSLPPRKAIFTHINDHVLDVDTELEYDRNKILISVHPSNPDVWYWLIPFSNGVSSFGVVGEPKFFESYPEDKIAALKQLATEEPGLAEILANAEYPNPAGEIGGYSANVKHLATDKYALLGNAGEFLDPVFSSGVTIAMKSAQFAVECVEKQLNGENVDWERDYAAPLMVGVNTFRTYVEGWYSGTLQDVIFYQDPNLKIKQMVCSILAGYAWDQTNPYVKESQRRLATLAEICRS
ncbi:MULTISPECIES: NAD(P)/FAD-dependent oxidoreductase [Vibrio]|jgi:flavin-dependent dehydrogenase|uniref:FAD-dependent oxidoreductase n=3 Tax=Vibrio cyclitrophicus TaxID=47951 RepID=A0A7Z1MG91_9VIBR|nr:MULTISPECIES: NAD(P)/FAD-dependent oxidoreductase [Vibrio]MBY7661569.1 tryptophan 7-halogenase [Vibrio atlanticus]ERM61577.1 FAD-binding protein [Vibrio cyclitrophicus FF75]KAA8596632.1 FAD-binding protein [Vibrio cyclitrophicus]MBE8554891.1 tryptophan 7-halogenase [Vibrio sp. OPT24]MBE8607015.1 tryptophan 7-halogenase [Vibrio sp. OPT10]|tara:strand:- start:1841 stop:3082 length:1242 start_codon:yes stop_codon:yes gene_type:complete